MSLIATGGADGDNSSTKTMRFGPDLLRAWAAILVVVAHGMIFAAPRHEALIVPAVLMTALGVEIFFVLSGYLIGSSLLKIAEGAIRPSEFLRRRWYRTLPNYYLFLLVHVAIVLVHNDAARSPNVSYIFFMQGLIAPPTTLFFPESWSLAVEEWFYLSFAVVAAICGRYRVHGSALKNLLWFLGATIVFTLFARAWWGNHNVFSWDEGLRKLALLRFDAIAVGVLAAAVQRHQNGKWKAAPRVYAATGCGLLIATLWQLSLIVTSGQYLAPLDSLNVAFKGSGVLLCLALAVALMLPCIDSLTESSSALANRGVRLLARWSCSIYLVHFPLLLLLMYHWPALIDSGAVVLMTTLAVWALTSIALAGVVYSYFELPLTRLRDRRR